MDQLFDMKTFESNNLTQPVERERVRQRKREREREFDERVLCDG